MRAGKIQSNNGRGWRKKLQEKIHLNADMQYCESKTRFFSIFLGLPIISNLLF